MNNGGAGQDEGGAEGRARGGVPTEEEIRAWLISNVSAVVEIDPQQIDVRMPLEHYGMDSVQAMHLSGDLQDWLGRELSPTVVWDYPTIEVLARHLAAEREST